MKTKKLACFEPVNASILFLYTTREISVSDTTSIKVDWLQLSQDIATSLVVNFVIPIFLTISLYVVLLPCKYKVVNWGPKKVEK